MALEELKSKSSVIPLEDSVISTKESKKASRKMYIPIKIQTNAIKKDDIAINATYISIEDLTNEEDRKKARERARNVEVRYLDNIKSIRDKIKSSYSCNKEHCPAIKERLEQHQLEHHSSSSPLHRCHRRSQTTLKSKEPDLVSIGTIHHLTTAEPHIRKSVSISPKPSILKKTINPRLTEHQSIQTTPKYMDFSHTTQNNYNNNLFKSDGHTNLNHNYLESNDFKPTETKISFTTRHCAMKDDLHAEIMKWYEEIPVYPNLNVSMKNLRKNLINEFVEKIYVLTNEENTIDDYEYKVKKEIEILLNTLPMWYPGTKRDQEILKDNIKHNLLFKIRNLRDKMYYEKSVDVQTDDLNVTNTHISLNQLENEKIAKLTENEILDWVMQIKFKESEDIGRSINIIDTTEFFAKRLMPLLNRPACTKNYKLVLKTLILDTFNDLPNVFQYPKNKRLYLNRIAEELTNRLLYIQVKCRSSNSCCHFPRNGKMYQMTVCSKSKMNKYEGLDYSLGYYHLYPRIEIIEDVTDIIVDCIDAIGFEDIRKRDESSEITQNSMESTETQVSITVSDAVVENVREALTEDIINHAGYSNASVNRHCLSSTVSVFKSEQDLSGRSSGPVTSTPKRKFVKKDIVKQNPEEVTYANKVSAIIRAWMETLPKNFDDDKKFKETIVMDLTGDVVDQIKTEQLVLINESDKNKIMYYTIFRWLYRFGIFEDELSEEVPQIKDLQNRLNQLSVPNLTKPRHGNRQAMANTKMKDSERDFFVPKGIDVLEDEISIWINEQPSDIYSKGGKDSRNKMIHELAKSLQNLLVNKRSDMEINKDINDWLKRVLKSSEKKNIDELTESLKNRIVNLPQDQTLNKNLHNKIQEKLQDEAARLNPGPPPIANESSPDIDADRTLREFISKYMEHNYDVDDTVARGAFGELLKTEIRKLSPPTRKEVYENFTKPHEEFTPDRLDKELQFIKIVSDWLKNLPIDNSFNTPHNKKRIDIVNDLARNIYEVEEERRRASTAMDYDMYLASIISQFTNLLRIPPEHHGHVMFTIDKLIGKVIAYRTPLPCCQNTNQTTSSNNTTGIPEQNISEFIHNYIHLNAGEFADDQMKMDAWSARLMKEVKKIVQSTADPSTLCKTQVYSNLMNVPIPEDESVKLFGLELGYAKEISDWLRNMPLVHLQTQEAKDERVKMISELAEKFSDIDRKIIINPSEPENTTEIEDFVTNWIKRIPLDPNKEIDIPILIKQLLRRIEKVKKNTEEVMTPEEIIDEQSPMKSKKSKVNKTRSKTQKCRPSCCNSSKGQPGQIIVEAIESWSNNLPIKSNDKSTDKTIKEDVARNLYQKVGNLSIDPQVMYDDNLFQELFTDEVYKQLNNLSENADIQKKKEALKNDLIEKVMEAKSIVKEAVAGENYKIRLENTIEASIPTPITNRQWYDPTFEIYKNRLADAFILDNFDHSNDAVKIKYERKIRDEVDKYFESAQKRNAVPLSKDEIFNELYSALFKVPIPTEASAIAEVEKVKMRCEIDMWFEGLPLRDSSDLNELLEWDNILSMLAKKLYKIESNEPNPDDKIHKEITKWVIKFPLIQGQESNADQFANDLQDRLKISKENRKCVTSSAKGKEIKSNPKQKIARENKSLVAGPSTGGRRSSSIAKSQPCCQTTTAPRKKPAELVLEIVETWCEQLPLPIRNPADEINNKIIRDNLLTQIIIKICVLNGNLQTFNDTILYEHFLDAELDNLLSEVPICCQFEETKNVKKKHLTEAIISLLPLMREEKACYEYKQELRTTINNVLEEPLNTTAEKITEINQLKDEIVDNFVLYHYNRDDDEGKQIYKANLYDVLSKYLQDFKAKEDDCPVDPLIMQNQLLCELAKVPIPCERVIKDEVEEIRMKDEVNEFFDELALADESDEKITLTKNIKLSLAKRLRDIEKTGHNCDNESKMKTEIKRCLKKIDLEIKSDKIDSFIDKLKNNEAIRKAPPIENKAYVSPPKHFDVQVFSGDVKEPNSEECCDIKECGGDRKSLEAMRSSPDYSDSMQQRNNHVSPATPSAGIPRISQNLEDPSDQVQRFAQGQVRNKRQGPNSEDEADNEDCKCERRVRRRYRGRPRCVLRLEDYCEECEQFRHMWMPMPYRMPPPRYYYY